MKKKLQFNFKKLRKLAKEIKELTEKERKEGKRNYDKEHLREILSKAPPLTQMFF